MKIGSKASFKVNGVQKNLIYFQIIYNFFIKWLLGFGIPSTANYVTDVITAILFVNIVMYAVNTPLSRKNKVLYVIPVIFFIYSVTNWGMHGYAMVYYLWGMRNLFRFYVFFIAVTLYFDEEDIARLIEWIFNLFIATIAMCLYQYIVRDLEQDYIAGFFAMGGTIGGNGPLQVLFVIVCIICFVQYMEKKINIYKLAIAVAGTLIVAVIGELKAMFLFFAAIVALTSLFTRFSIKKLFIVLAIACVIPLAINMLYKLFPNFDGFFSVETINEYAAGAQGYTGREDINRLSSIQFCFDNFLKTPGKQIFGMGMGSTDGSPNFDMVTTTFYKMYSERTHYNWFSVPMILLENGLIGLSLYFAFFVMVFKDATKARKLFPQKKEILIIAQILAIFGIVLSFYNQALKVETMGYIFYAFMAIPYVLMNTNRQEI